MAKELPYFKFEPAEWITGRISLESFEIQGAFINICCIYWQKLGELTINEAKKRLKDSYDLLVEYDFIIENNDFITIKFLDDQLSERIAIREKRQESGAKGGKTKIANAKQMLSKSKANANIIEEKRREEKREEKKKIINIDFDVFWNLYNKKVGSKAKCKAKWDKLKDEEREKIINTLPLFLKNITELKYQPHPLTYLNNERWEDELKVELNYDEIVNKIKNRINLSDEEINFYEKEHKKHLGL